MQQERDKVDKANNIPSVAINNVPIDTSIPMTTEEPVRRDWLKTELQDINNNSDSEDSLIDKDDNTETELESDDDDSASGQNKIKEVMKDSEGSVNKKDQDDSHGSDIMVYLQQEMSRYQNEQDEQVASYEKEVNEANTEEDLLGVEDPELLRRTESNRIIPYEKEESVRQRSDTIHGQSDTVHRNLLVFSDNPIVIEDANRLCVIQYYGAGKSGIMPTAYRRKRKAKSYLVACDFSKESLYAIEWTMGTMMRDGDELCISTVANRDDNPDIVKQTGLDQTSELRVTSDALIKEAKKLLGQMMLFNIKLVTHAMVGRVKDALESLTRECDYTMIVCGSRGRGSVRKLLMGSVSTYLVHKSPVPVTVIRRQKKKKRAKHDITEAHSLSESVKNGQLHVDELS